MVEQRSVDDLGTEISGLLDHLAATADPGAARMAEELVRGVTELYGAGLERILEIVASAGPAVTPLLDMLGDDDLVSGLLCLHGLHPVAVETRAERALESVRPYLGSHGGDVELLGVDDGGVVRLRMHGTCDGCPSSAATLTYAIEGAITKAAPEVSGIDVDGLTPPPAPAPGPAHTPAPAQAPSAGNGLIPPEALLRRPDGHDRHDGRDGGDRSWTRIESLPELVDGPTRIEVGGVALVVCRLGGQLYAYRDGCPECGRSLAGGGVIAEALECPACAHRYDVRRAGRAVDGGAGHLEPVPLIADERGVRVALAGALA